MEQQLIRERYELSMARILKFQEEQTVTEPYRDFFTAMSRFIGLCGRVMEAVEEGTFGSWTEEELKELNEKLYEDIRRERYETSYGNPAWAVSRLGKELGRLLCFLYSEIRGDIAYAFEGRMLELSATACYTVGQLAVNGASLMDAGITPGPAVGKALNTLLRAVMEGRLPNEKAALLAALEKEGLL